MIGGLKPYPDYRDSGVPWLGRIPSHWGVVRSKRMFSARNELARPTDVQLSATQAYGVIPQAEFEARVGRRVVKISMHLEKRRHVEKDDFVISMRSFQGGLERAWATGCIRSSYVVLKPVADVDPGFFRYLFKSPGYIRALQSTADFIRDGQDLNYGDFCAVDLPAVPLADQRAIARFLDRVDGSIRRCIKAKRNLIALLHEQKQAILHRAVERGLNLDVPLKPSGAGWLENVPAHWYVKRLKWAVRLQRGYDLPEQSRIEGPYPVVSSGGTIGYHSEYRSRGPAVVIGRYGSTDAVFYVETDFWPHNTALFTTTFQGNDPRWCYSILRAISKADHSGKSAIPGVDRKDLYEIRVAVPPVPEQRAIADRIDASFAAADRAVANAEREARLLLELRQQLLESVVTGRLDVRSAALGSSPLVSSRSVDTDPFDTDAEDEECAGNVLDEGDA